MGNLELLSGYFLGLMAQSAFAGDVWVTQCTSDQETKCEPPRPMFKRSYAKSRTLDGILQYDCLCALSLYRTQDRVPVEC